MTPQAADALAKRIINTWHTRIPLDEWTSTLLDLDEGTAGRTFARLKVTDEHGPSIARFMHTYRAQHTPANDPTSQPHTCDRCDNNGIIAAWLDHNPRTGTTFTGTQTHYRYAHNCPACKRAPWLPDLPTNLPPGATQPDPPEAHP